MQRTKYDQFTEHSDDGYQALAMILSYMFSDDHIFENKEFRKLIKNNPKGYVHLSSLSECHKIKTFFDDLFLTDTNNQFTYLRGVIESKCSELHYHSGKVRRKIPFDVEKFRKVRPICIERFVQPISVDEIRNLFEEHVYFLNCDLASRNIEKDLVVFSQEYRGKLKDIRSQTEGFSIMSFEEFYRQQDLTSRMKKRKYKNVMKPMETPKKRGMVTEDDDRDEFELEMEANYGKYRKHSKDHPTQAKNRDIEEFNSLAKEPNPAFNSLLKNLVEGKGQQMMDESYEA